MEVGDLVKVIDYDAGGGFAPSPEYIGIIVSIAMAQTCPNAVDIMLSSGVILHQWEDELEVIKAND